MSRAETEGRYRFAFRGRWLFGWFLVALVSLTFIRLGIWQLDRMEWRRELNTRIEQRRSQAPVSIDSLDAGSGSGGLEYRNVSATGTYDTTRETILYGRARNGQAGNHLVTPLALADGSVVFVDRGWVPLAEDSPGALDEATPDGEATVEGILLPPESDDDRPDADTVKDVSLVQLSKRTDADVWPVYLLLRSQNPPQDGPFPEPVPEPRLSGGPHLSYAFQWFTFTIIAIVGWTLLLRREARDRRAEQGAAGAGADGPESDTEAGPTRGSEPG